MKRSIAFVLFLAVLFSCKEEQQKPETILVPSANETADMNKTWNQEEQELIHQFIQRKGWEMRTDSSIYSAERMGNERDRIWTSLPHLQPW